MAQSLKPHIYDDTIYMSKLFEMIDTQYNNKKILWSELAKFKDHAQLSGVPLTTFAANVGLLRSDDTDQELIDRITFELSIQGFFGTQEDYYNLIEFYFGFSREQVKIREVSNARLVFTFPQYYNSDIKLKVGEAAGLTVDELSLLTVDELAPLVVTDDIINQLNRVKAAGVRLEASTVEYIIDFTYTELLNYSYTELLDLKYKRS
jgi:hypothetical protein